MPFETFRSFEFFAGRRRGDRSSSLGLSLSSSLLVGWCRTASGYDFAFAWRVLVVFGSNQLIENQGGGPLQRIQIRIRRRVSL